MSRLAPTLKVQAKSCVFKLTISLTELLKKHPEVALEAQGAAEKSLRLVAMSSASVQKATGYLPGFGVLGLRLDRFEASKSDGPSLLRGRVGRLLDSPFPSEDTVQVVKKTSPWLPLAEDLRAQLDEGDQLYGACLRFVGAAAAERALLAAQHVQQQLQGSEAHRGQRLALCPSIGVSLTDDFRHSEVLLLVCPWANIASEVPGVAPVRPHHSEDFLALG